MIIGINKMASKQTGHNPKDVIGKNLRNFVDKQYISLLEENIKKRINGCELPPYEVKLANNGGEAKFLEIKGNRVQYGNQTLDLVVFHDITERSKQQNKLQQDLLESQEKFQGITNSVRDAIILADEEARVTYWNPAAEKIFGYTSDEAIGKLIHELVVPESTCKEGKERIDASVKMFTETGMGYFTVGKVELVGRRKDGAEFPVELSISPIKLGGKWNAVGVAKDITQRKNEERQLKEAEKRYRALFNQAPQGVVIIDVETAAFIEFNDVAHIQLGYSREEFEKLTIADIEFNESLEQIKFHIAHIVKEGEGEFESKHRTKAATVRNVLITTRTLELAGEPSLLPFFMI